MKKSVLVLAALVCASLGFVSCSGSSSTKLPPSKLTTRVVVSQAVTSTVSFAGLVIVDGVTDKIARASEISAGNSPGFMALSPTRATLLIFDSSTNSVQIVNTVTETNTGRIQLLGSTTSMVVPATTGIGYAAVPTASINGFPKPGAIQVMNLAAGGIITTIGVPSAQTVVSNANGAQLLVFSSDSNSVSVISPLLAIPPVDFGCDNVAVNSVCTVVPGFDHPVNAIISGSTAYILNCGPECLGTQASVMVFDLGSLTVTNTIPVNGATDAFLSGSTLYVVGTPPGVACPSGTAAALCGTLDIVDLGSMADTNFANPILITNGYHDRIDMSVNGQLYIGSYNCTDVGNVNNPSGEVRGCLSIFDTTNPGNAPVIPPDNGDVTGLQSFTSISQEYVIEGGNLRIYDTTKNVLAPAPSGQTTPTTITGQPVDVKAIDFF